MIRSLVSPAIRARVLSLLTVRDYRHDVAQDLGVRRLCEARLRRVEAIMVLYQVDASLLETVETGADFDQFEARLVVADEEQGGSIGQLPLREFLAEPQGNASERESP